MTVSVGSVVRCLNGRDEGHYLVVVGVDGEYLLLADGKRRKIENPKNKKAKHIADTGIKADFSDSATNRKIRNCLNRIDFSLEPDSLQR